MITYDVVNQVARITIDDPRRRNPLSNAAMAELTAAVDRARDDDTVRVVVITGAGDRAFSAGGDLAAGFVDAPLASHDARGALADLFRAIRSIPKPVVARVNGAALGGGFGLAVACDITIAVRGVKMGTPEIDLGLWPMMISAILLRSMPRKPLVEMMLTGRVITSDDAYPLGLVSRLVDRDDLDEVVDATVDLLVAKSPSTLALGKRALLAVDDLDLDSALDLLQMGLTATAMTEDGVEGVAAFTEKRSPEWRGR